MNETIRLTIDIGFNIIVLIFAIVTVRKYRNKYNYEVNKNKEMKVISGNKDKLTTIFEYQKELQKKFYDGKLPADEPKIMGENILALVAELGEVMQEDKRWKGWCKNPPKPNFDDKKKEIIDCWHFIINLCIYSNMDAEELFLLFITKNKENIKRQETNY